MQCNAIAGRHLSLSQPRNRHSASVAGAVAGAGMPSGIVARSVSASGKPEIKQRDSARAHPHATGMSCYDDLALFTSAAARLTGNGCDACGRRASSFCTQHDKSFAPWLASTACSRARHFFVHSGQRYFLVRGSWSPHAMREIHNFHNPQFDPRQSWPCASNNAMHWLRMIPGHVSPSTSAR
jgi:hypothetical protein